MRTQFTEAQLIKRIRLLVAFFMGALVVSGITAFPIEWGMREILCPLLNVDIHVEKASYDFLQKWLFDVYQGVSSTNASYPFMAYGTDWLAFAHIVIALVFLGVCFKPVRNIWIVYWAMIACVLIIPLAFICGYVREIPFFWILIDCSFGVVGIIPLLLLRSYINELARISGCYVPTKY